MLLLFRAKDWVVWVGFLVHGEDFFELVHLLEHLALLRNHVDLFLVGLDLLALDLLVGLVDLLELLLLVPELLVDHIHKRISSLRPLLLARIFPTHIIQ